MADLIVKSETDSEAAEKLADAIDLGDFTSGQILRGSGFGRALSEALSRRGWKKAKMYSTMKYNTFETKLAKEGKARTITSAVFMGPFTQIEGY